MKKLFMLLALGGFLACASLYAQDEEDFKTQKIQMDDEDETVYQTDEGEDFNIGYTDDWGNEE